jgi:plastocyanin
MSRTSVAGCVLILSCGWSPGAASGQTVSGNVIVFGGEDRAVKKPTHAGAVVWLEPIEPRVPAATSPPKPAVMIQRNQAFNPRLLAVEVGTAVDFPNNDAILHNVFSNVDGQVFDLQLYAPQAVRRVVFRRPGFVRVFCNIHESMSAIIAVMPTPYFGLTDAAGRFDIPAPAGAYRLQFWHERARADTLARLTTPVTVAATAVSLPDTRIAVAAQTPLHKDKYGHDYAPRADDRVFYPGARR